jgi:hypothetical protein
MGYSRVVGDSQCNKKKIKKESSHVLKHGTKKSKSQAQKMTLTAGQSTQHKEVCMSGAIELPNVAYNIALVLDHSVSTGLESTGGSRRLHNSNDGPSDTILDTEMAAALGLLESICGQGELDNDSVTIGFISFNVSNSSPCAFLSYIVRPTHSAFLLQIKLIRPSPLTMACTHRATPALPQRSTPFSELLSQAC